MIQVPEAIKELLKQGSVRKNFRVKFPNGEHTDLTNENIISESVSFTESLCSQDTLKFGLCEANTISFQTFGVGNIKGKTIDCSIGLDVSNVVLDEYYTKDNYGNTFFVKTHVNGRVDIQGEAEYPISVRDNPDVYLKLYDVDLTSGPIHIWEDITDDMLELWRNGEEVLVGIDPLRGYVMQLMADDDVLLSTTEESPEATASIKNTQIRGKETYLRLAIAPYDLKIVGTTTSALTAEINTTIYPYPRNNLYTRLSEDNLYYIPYGRFIVDSCDRDSGNMQKRKVEAYGLEIDINNTSNRFVDFIEKAPISSNEPQVFNVYEYLTYYLYQSLYNLPGKVSVDTRVISKTSANYSTPSFAVVDDGLQLLHMNTPKFYNSGFDGDSIVTSTSYRNGSKMVGTDNKKNRLFVNVRIQGYFSYMASPYGGINSVHLPNGVFTDAKELAIAVYDEIAKWESDVESWGMRHECYTDIGLTWKLELWEGLGYLYVSDDYERIVYDITDGKNAVNEPSYYNFQPYTISPVLLIPTLKSQQNNGFSDAMSAVDNELFRLGGGCSLFVPTKIVISLDSYENGTATSVGALTRTLKSTTVDLLEDDFELNFIRGSDLCSGLNWTYNTYTLSLKRVLDSSKQKYVVQSDNTDKMQLLEAFCELSAVFGKVGRSHNLWEFVSVRNSIGIYPSEDLFPHPDIYPSGQDENTSQLYDKSMYSQAWYSDSPTELYSGVTCTISVNDNEQTYTEYAIEPDSPDYTGVLYDISDNMILQNYVSSTESISESDIRGMLSGVLNRIRRVRYMPADIDCIGLPYLEAGDAVDVFTSDGAFETLVLRRTLSGIQALSDNIESRG